MITKRPLAGFAASIIFVFLGMLLIQVDTAPGAPQGLSRWLFKIVGYFILFVALGTFVTAVYSFWKNRRT